MAELTVNEKLIARLDDEQLKAIGRVTVSYSILDFMARSLLARLVGGLEQTALTLVITEGFEWTLRKIEILKGFASRLDVREAIQEWLSVVRDLKQRRNIVIHSLWVVAEGQDKDRDRDSEKMLTRLRFTARKAPLRFDLTEVSVDELNRLADDIEHAAYVGGQISLEIIAPQGDAR
jgi:hypothetical protein